MAGGKLRFGKVIWCIRRQDPFVRDPANRLQLKAGTLVNYVGPRSAVRIVVESHDANALLAYRAVWSLRLVVGFYFDVPPPPPGVRVWAEKPADSRPPDSGATVPPRTDEGRARDQGGDTRRLGPP